MFAGEFPQRLADISSALADSDFDELQAIAHSLKGVSANLSATSVFLTASQLEQAAGGRNAVACRALLSDLRHAGEEFLQFTQQYRGET